MARVDYYAIEQELQSVLAADSSLQGTQIMVEEPIQFAKEVGRWVEIYGERRDAPSELQRVAGGTILIYRLRLAIWCYAVGMKVSDAIKNRDELLGTVEIAIMNARIQNQLTRVRNLSIEGGELPPAFQAEKNSGLISAGEIIVACEVTVSTDASASTA